MQTNTPEQKLNLRLVAYSALAAAGSIPATSEAAIEYSGNYGFTPLTWNAGDGPQNINFPGLGQAYFRFNFPISSSSVSALIQRVGSYNQHFINQTGNNPDRLGLGAPISVGQNWYPMTIGTNTAHDIATISGAGNWYSFSYGTLQGYVGFRFNSGSQDLYGWFDVSFDNAIGLMTVDGWAYDDSGNGISAGEFDNGVPEAGSTASMLAIGLAALATGAAGIRRRRAAKAA